MSRHCCTSLLFALLVFGWSGYAETTAATAEPTTTASNEKVSEQSKPPVAKPVYVPPRRGAPTTRVGGGTRSGSQGTPSVEVLAPPHTGLTGKAAPTLYWWLSNDYQGPLELVVTPRDETEPLMKRRMDDTFRAGLHALDLAANDVILEPGKVYQWSVALVRDDERRSHDVVAIATIERTQASASQEPGDLAAAGLWYDAVEALSRAAESDAAWRDARADLLEQGELPAVAAWDRAAR